MRCLLLTTFLAIVTAVHAADPLASLTDDVARGNWVQSQVRELSARMEGFNRPSCGEALAPVAGPHRPTPAHLAVYALERVTDLLKAKLDVACLNRLVQNLALVDDPVNARLIATLSDRHLDPAVSRFLFSQERYCGVVGTNFQGIEDLLAAAVPLAACATLAPGQHRVVETTAAYGNQLNYTLLAEAPQRHRVLLHARFIKNSSGAMLRRVQRCLEAVGPHLRSPDGNRLAFTILDDAGAARLSPESRPRPVEINVTAAGTRSFARGYAADIDCPTIVHEVLHLVGLCDEYHGNMDRSPCRAPGAEDSVMRNQARAFHSHVPRRVTCRISAEVSEQARQLIRTSRQAQRFLQQPGVLSFVGTEFLNAYCTYTSSPLRRTVTEGALPARASFAPLGSEGILLTNWAFSTGQGDLVREEYRCQCTDDVCRRTRRALLDTAQPRLPEDCQYPLEPETVAWGSSDAKCVVAGDQVSFGIAADGRGLLSNAHVREALTQGCQGANGTYRACAQRAYQSSCDPMPAQCRGNWTR